MPGTADLTVSGRLELISPINVWTAPSYVPARLVASQDYFMPAAAASSLLAPHQGLPPAHPGLRSLLKEATADAHRDLDARLSGLGLASLDGYRRFLEANAAALWPVEDALEAAGVADIFTDWPQRARRAAMAEDLAKVGGEVHPVPPMPGLNRNGVFGTMYVLEGSRLGAKYLLRGVGNAADPVVASATAYLSHGAGQHFWQTYLAALEQEPATSSDAAEIVAAANTAFAMFAEAAARA
jgi:heme oxygenase (biliverdin-IX-beta and delta-forming)